jgi:hypothetical protein
MKPTRQIEAAQLMIASNVFSGRFAEALLAGTRDDLLVDSEKEPRTQLGPRKARMEHETDSLLRNLKAVENSYGEEVLELSVSSRYLGKVVGNSQIRAYLKRHHLTLLGEIQGIVAAVEGDSASRSAPTPTLV